MASEAYFYLGRRRLSGQLMGRISSASVSPHSSHAGFSLADHVLHSQ